MKYFKYVEDLRAWEIYALTCSRQLPRTLLILENSDKFPRFVFCDNYELGHPIVYSYFMPKSSG